MFSFPAALISKEPDFCFLDPKKTAERFRVLFKCVSFPAKHQLWGNFLPQAPRSSTASKERFEDSAASPHPIECLPFSPPEWSRGCFLMVFWLLNAFLISEQFWDLMGETEGKGNVWEPKSGIEILFWFRVLEPVPCLICTHGGFLFDTGTKEGPWRHGLVTKEVSPTMVICIHSWNPDEDLLFVCFPLKSNPIVFVFKICTHLYNNLYLVVFGTIREKNFGFRPSCNFYIIVLFLFLK